eukprot:8304758-Alexandrium_andersonii.AAC.1
MRPGRPEDFHRRSGRRARVAPTEALLAAVQPRACVHSAGVDAARTATNGPPAVIGCALRPEASSAQPVR